MHNILLHALAAILYGGLAVHFWRTRWQGPLLDRPSGGLRPLERLVLLLALVVHALSLRIEIFGDGQMRFGFAIAISVMMWLATALYWIESFYARMDGLQVMGLPLTAVAVLLPGLFTAPHLLANAGSPGFRLHFLTAMLAYILFMLAALHALLMSPAARHLHAIPRRRPDAGHGADRSRDPARRAHRHHVGHPL